LKRETGDSETEEERYRKIKRDDMDWTDRAGYNADRVSADADSKEVAGDPDLGNFADRVGDRADRHEWADKVGDSYDAYKDIGKSWEKELDKFANSHDGIGEKKAEKKEEKKEELFQVDHFHHLNQWN